MKEILRRAASEILGGSSDAALLKVLEQLQTSLNNSMDLLGEDAPRKRDVFISLRYLSRFVQTARLAIPTGRSQIAAAEGARAPLPGEMVELATYVHHAQLVYESEEVIRACLGQCGMVLYQHCTHVDIGRVAHYTALDHTHKIGVISIKGTENLEEVLTDVIAHPECLGPRSNVSAHSGFAQAARGVVNDVQEFIRACLQWGYNIVVTGHSLGAGTANCVAKLLHDNGVRVRCYGYATPPCFDIHSALTAAPFITNVCHNDDVVTRASVFNFKCKARHIQELIQILASGEVLSSDEMHKADPSSLEKWEKTVPVVSTMLRHVVRTTQMEASQRLIVPGRVVYLFHEVGQYRCVVKDGTLFEMGYIFLTPSMLSDHGTRGYILGTAEVAGQMTGRHEHDFSPWLKPERQGLPQLLQTQLPNPKAWADKAVLALTRGSCLDVAKRNSARVQRIQNQHSVRVR